MQDPDTKAQTIEAQALARTIAPILAGHPPGVQGAALADLLATWLAGHIGSTPEVTATTRNGLLALHIKTVRALAAIADKVRAERAH
jgi:xanthine/uracil permease